VYDNVAKTFHKFLNNDNLQDILDTKVDMEIIKKLQEQKADKGDIDDNSRKIDSLNKRLKNVCVLLNELARSVIPQ
jgi:DNA-binding transcriptional regulator GbsR (MarR family)